MTGRPAAPSPAATALAKIRSSSASGLDGRPVATDADPSPAGPPATGSAAAATSAIRPPSARTYPSCVVPLASGAGNQTRRRASSHVPCSRIAAAITAAPSRRLPAAVQASASGARCCQSAGLTWVSPTLGPPP